jgi:hypothetical protein
LSFGNGSGKPVITLDPSSEHQEMLAFGICYAVLWRAESERELGAVDGAQVVRECRLSEAGCRIEAVMVGDRQRV